MKELKRKLSKKLNKRFTVRMFKSKENGQILHMGASAFYLMFRIFISKDTTMGYLLLCNACERRGQPRQTHRKYGEEPQRGRFLIQTLQI